jgi:deoxyadenosine/deoxycytidine kinase
VIHTDDLFIGVAGNIGAGKSTLTQMLANHFGWQPFFEANAENPYLADFYDDMQRWSFQSQVFFLGKRLEHHRQLLDYPGSAVQDRTIYEDAEIFARNLYEQGHMSERDYATYCSLYKAITLFLPPPSMIIYLQSSVDTLMSHIAKRGRTFEQNISRDYIEQLNRHYDDWIDDWAFCPVLKVSMDEYDFQNNNNHFGLILLEVEAKLARSIR